MSSRMIIAVVAAVAVASGAVADIERQTGTVVGEVFETGPVIVTADPFTKFDPMGGTRRLDRVRIDLAFEWEAVLQLANPLPEQQIMTYQSYPEPSGGIDTNTHCDFRMWVFGSPGGTMSAAPFQTVQSIERYGEPSIRYFDVGTEDPEFASLIGPGDILITRFGIGSQWDTFRIINGQPQGGPAGFSVIRETYTVQLTYEYEFMVVPGPGGLATLALVGLGVVNRRFWASRAG